MDTRNQRNLNMAHFESTDLGVSFDLPDDPTALEILTYDSNRMEHYSEKAIVLLWECIKPLITNWACEALPDKTTNLATVKSLKAAMCVEWAAFRGSEWRLSLDTVPKN